MTPSRMAAQTTQFAAWVVGTLLSLRFALRLFNADATNRVVQWVYDISQPAVTPFFQWFDPVRQGDGFVIEVGTLFALVAYSAIAFVVLAVVGTYRAKANNAANEAKSRFNISFNKQN